MIRIIKRDQRGAAEEKPPSSARDERSAERVARKIVSEWVREHARRAEEYRLGYAAMLKEYGFR